jgi:hypothetical protein
LLNVVSHGGFAATLPGAATNSPTAKTAANFHHPISFLLLRKPKLYSPRSTLRDVFHNHH